VTWKLWCGGTRETCPFDEHIRSTQRRKFQKRAKERDKVGNCGRFQRHMGHLDKADRMASSFTASRSTWKWTRKLFFHTS